jgi:hypothetical protein
VLRGSPWVQSAHQAKGKTERQHPYWQGRLPALFAAETVTTPEAANALLSALRRHRNAHEIHRELGRTPNAAARAAQRGGRSVLRPAQRCAWWPYLWSLRTPLRVAPDRRVPVGSQRLRVEVGAGTQVVHCQHSDGSISVLAHEPKARERPALLLQVRNP